jgi:hypothetical protein
MFVFYNSWCSRNAVAPSGPKYFRSCAGGTRARSTTISPSTTSEKARSTLNAELEIRPQQHRNALAVGLQVAHHLGQLFQVSKPGPEQAGVQAAQAADPELPAWFYAVRQLAPVAARFQIGHHQRA